MAKIGFLGAFGRAKDLCRLLVGNKIELVAGKTLQ